MPNTFASFHPTHEHVAPQLKITRDPYRKVSTNETPTDPSTH